MTTLALTDRDTVAGTVRFAKAAAAAGIRPVFGVDVAPVTPSDPAAGRPRTPVRGGAHVVEPSLRITLLAQTSAGWARLCRLVSAAYAGANGGLPVMSWPVLREYADQDLVVLLGPASEPGRALSAGRIDVAEQLLAPWRELVGRASAWKACIWAAREPVRGRCGWPRGPWAWPTSLVCPWCRPTRSATPTPLSTGSPTCSMRRGCRGPSTAGTWTAASAG
jgi:hypothetical protein